MRWFLPAVIGMALLVAGCFEVDSKFKVREDGSVNAEVRFAFEPQFLAMIESQAASNSDVAWPIELLKNCGKPMPQDQLPPGVASVRSEAGQFAGMLACTFHADIADPMATYEAFRAKAPGPGYFAIEPLESRNGYRTAAVLEFPQNSQAEKNAAGAEMGAALINAMFAGRYISVEVSGLRIEKTNGRIASDRKSASWQIPIAAAINPGPSSAFEIRAEVTYRETFYERMKRRLLAFFE